MKKIISIKQKRFDISYLILKIAMNGRKILQSYFR